MRLGNQWSFFCQPRAELRLLGTVQDGMQIGALAQLPDGAYAQVNGDLVRILNTSRVEHALDRATGTPRAARNAPPPPRPPEHQPIVTIKKKRRIIIAP
ncbi:hypothetical protein ACSFA8_12670 [Variovorax sp. RT4R15]|uniref:hypothetical protein n=1 Tax=Variovorax sp. RT4R15 TaxID=3443737 RepID=UPI003F459116